ncbi:MAG: ACP phosphodiesterase [Bacteroidales bacterium]
MNFLAHTYFAGDNHKKIVGSFIADYVKGRDYNKYSKDIRDGILLHRLIDSFIDNNTIAKESGSLFAEKYRRYKKVVIDIVYDHFLAKHWDRFSEISLREYTHKIHKILLSNFIHIPNRMKIWLPAFISRKQLVDYAEIKGIEKVLVNMGKHTSLPSEAHFAIQIIEANLQTLEQQFFSYMKEAQIYTDKVIDNPEKYL